MISLPIGAVLTTLVFLFSMGIGNLPIYFNFHSMLIVCGGTAAILLFSSPITVLKNLIREIGGLFQRPTSFKDIKEDLIKLTQNRDSTMTNKDELIQYAQDLWLQGTTQDLFVVLLSQKRKEIEQRSVDAIQCLKNLAKYPPALGMAGTVMGIVTLFQSLDGNKEKIGPGLAIAMTATFFGLIIANGIVMPLSDRLQVKQLAQTTYLQNLYQVILLINQDEPAELVADEVRARAS
jgi:chemotaxis protein MotA